MKFSLNKSPYSFYYFVMTAIVLLLFIFQYHYQKALESEKLMTQSEKIILNNRAILINTINIETGFRGYVLTKDKSFLNYYDKSKIDILINLGLILNLTKDDKMQQARILLLKKRINEKLITVSKNINYFRKNNFNIDGKWELFNIGKNQTESIRELIEEINNKEKVLYNIRKLDNYKENQYSRSLLFTILLLLILISILNINSLKKQTIINNELSTLTDSQKSYSKYTLSLIEASLDPLVTINTEGKITDMNEATERITGIERSKLIGSDFFDHFTEQQKKREVYQEVFEKGSVADSPLTLRHKDGKLTDVLFNGSVYKDDDGNVMGVVIVARDIAEQKRIENELIEAKISAEKATAIA